MGFPLVLLAVLAAASLVVADLLGVLDSCSRWANPRFHKRLRPDLSRISVVSTATGALVA